MEVYSFPLYLRPFKSKAALKTAVKEYNANPTAATVTYGPIADWDVSAITDMSDLFDGYDFNADISNWNTSSVTDMSHMFSVRSSPCPAINLQSSPPLHAACTERLESGATAIAVRV